ncbi:hypothetical protein EGH24_07475 [Halonotius terrestris]|uniref:DUF7115 domain-containing protein n=1 Tax=Halonotius terrestris TaxID=2487750 RepID=A0A8J8PBJ3_9EURY|nr:PH domain-containing protein [Halonotius terrestris]TQQ80987.1 hypothetical protein EGH24_07475 [Halonotius terrestris]
MSLPDVLDDALEGEPAVAEVALGGEDVLVVTPTRTLVYRAEGLLSDESVEEYPHDAERISLSVGRRKAKLTMEYGLDGNETLALPASKVDDAIHPILAGVINAAGVTEPGETVLKTFRFSDLTLIVTSERVVKHIGSAVWTEDFETFEYDTITDVAFEEGSVATSVVLTHGGRQDRFKTPNDEAREVREAIIGAVCEYHDINSITELRAQAEDDAEPTADGDADDTGSSNLDFGEGLDPLSTDPDEVDDAAGTATTEPTADDASDDVSDEALAASIGDDGGSGTQTTTTESAATPTTDSGGAVAEADSTAEDPAPATGSDDADATTGFEGSGFESAGPVDEDDMAEQLAVLVERVEQQERKIDRQTELLETLIEELRRGR